MSYKDPLRCRNKCGAWIYFDAESKVGHPTADKWVPLEYNNDAGIRTGLVHQCPKKPSAPKLQQSSNLTTGSTQTTAPKEQHEQAYIDKVTDESVQRGITALKMFSDLAIQVDGIGVDCNQTRVILEDLQQKMDRLLNLVYAQQRQQQKQVEK